MSAAAKGEAPSGATARGFDVAHQVSRHYPADAAEKQARLRASLARRGYVLEKLPGNAWLICRWDRSCTLEDLQAVEQFLRRAEGPM